METVLEMTANNVLVIGGGVTGTVAAIALAQKGVTVTLIEVASKWFGVGHGITVQGNALKMFREIGVLDRILEKAHPFNDLDLCNADGSIMATLATPKTGGDDLPATMGALRSDLQAVLLDTIRDLGIDVRLGTTMASFENLDDHVSVTLSTGETYDFDLVVAADGIKSKTRVALGIPNVQAPTGLGIWRTVTERTPQMDHAAVYYHGPEYKAGFTPISDTLCYAYVLTDPVRPDNGLSDAEEMRRLLAGYHGHFDVIRENLSDDDFMNFQPIEWLFAEGSWHQGRVIAIGDAVHACPPLIAQGAAQCTEDAVLLADYATRDGDMEQLLTEYEVRRKARVKIVVDASLQLVEWELHPETPGANPGAVMGASLGALTQPA
jgi:2-polyprenyl-6-methoxyphenol hydroxylase-like FAD-dependent oxidoreductase